jgi:oligopeptide/dipeptide ABC transporter ATP-binding protein
MSEPLLRVTNLVKHYASGGWGQQRLVVRAVDGVSFELAAGETLALVGESGCGKSTTGLTILRLHEPTSGEVTFDGQRVFALGRRELQALRRRMQVIFQDPYGSLNPRMTIGDAIAEGLHIHRLVPRPEVAGRVASLLSEVGLDPAMATRYPHEFSGGQRQRIGIARALAVEPAFIVCDEPVSSLDVSVQAQVINLLMDLQASRGLAYLFIAHDLAVVRQIARRIAVMYLGQIVETGDAEAVLANPRHPYTLALISAVPRPDPATNALRIILPGEPPSPTTPPGGCRFHPRCFHRLKSARCSSEVPSLRVVDSSIVACHYAESSP